jgi:hypothetical protein
MGINMQMRVYLTLSILRARDPSSNRHHESPTGLGAFSKPSRMYNGREIRRDRVLLQTDESRDHTNLARRRHRNHGAIQSELRHDDLIIPDR